MANWASDLLQKGVQAVSNTAPVKAAKKVVQTAANEAQKTVVKPTIPAQSLSSTPEVQNNPLFSKIATPTREQEIMARGDTIGMPKTYTEPELKKEFIKREEQNYPKVYTEQDLIDTLAAKKQTIPDTIISGELGGLYNSISSLQNNRETQATYQQTIQSMKPEEKHNLAFETVTRIINEKKQRFAEQEKEQFKKDVENVIRKRMGVASFTANPQMVQLMYESSTPKEQQSIKDEIQATKDKYRFMESIDQGFINSLPRDIVSGLEKQVKISEAASKPFLSMAEGAISAATFGISDVIKGQAEEFKRGLDPDTGGYEPSTRAMYEENKGLELATDIASGITNFIGSLTGGYYTYSAVSSQVEKAFEQVPGKVGKILRDTPILSAYVFNNIGEEVVEAGVRKTTGQEYGFQDFMRGVMMGGIMQAAVKPMLNAVNSRALKNVEKAIIEAENIKQAPLTIKEVEEVVSPIKYNSYQTFGDLYAVGEKRMVGYKGLRKGTPGIDYPVEPPKVMGEVKYNEKTNKFEPIEKESVETQKDKIVVEKILPRMTNSEAGMRIREELANAMPPERFQTSDGEWTGYKSTFPEWIPEDLRSTKLLNKIEEHFQNNTLPTGERQKALYNLVKEKIETEFHHAEGVPSLREMELQAEGVFENIDKIEANVSKLYKSEEKLAFVQSKLDDLRQSGFTTDKSAKVKKLEKMIEGYQKKISLGEKVSEVKSLSDNKLDITTLATGEGGKEARIKEIQRVIAKRQFKEKQIATGDFSMKDKIEFNKIRKTGGLSQDMIDIVDKQISKGSKLVGENIVKLVKAVTPEKIKRVVNKLSRFESLGKEATSPLEIYSRSIGREKSELSDMIEGLKTVVDEKVANEPDVREQLMRYLTTGDDDGISKELVEVAKPVRDEIAIEGLRQVQSGNLDIETYYKNMDQYLRRVYASREVEGFEFLAENYNTLKNTLLSEGWDGIEAEKFINDLQIGAVSSKDVGKLQQLTGKKTEISGEGVRAGNKGVTGGFLESRVLGDDKTSLAIRNFLGEIKDPLYLANKTLWQLKKSRLNYELYKSFEGTGIIKDKLVGGEATDWVKIEGKSFGKEFEGKYINKEVFDYIQRFNKPVLAEDASTLQKIGQAINSFIKGNVTSRNLPGQFKNFVSNFSASRTILGHNFFSPSGLKEMVEAGKEIINKGDFYQELKAYGRIEGNINKEIYSEMAEKFAKIKGDEKGIQAGVMKVFKDLDKKAGDLYSFNDQLFLVANYTKLRAKGMSPLKALAEANRVTPNYEEISPLLKQLRSSFFGIPFVTWRAKVYPEVVKNLISNPIRTTQDLWMPFAVAAGTTSGMNLTEKEREMVSAKMLRDGEIPIYRDENGKIVMFNYMAYTPFGDLFKGGEKNKGLLGWVPDPAYGFVKGAVPTIGSLPVQYFMNMQMNYDPFLQREITRAEAGSPEWILDMANYLSSPVVPFFGSSARNIGKVMSGDMSIGEAAVKSTTGLKVNKIDVGSFEKVEKYRDIDFTFNKEQGDIKRRMEDIMSMENKEEAGIKYNQLKSEYPQEKDYIKKRFDAEKTKKELPAQKEIRQELTSIIDLKNTDKVAARKRYAEIKAKYPEQKDYIEKKFKELREG